MTEDKNWLEDLDIQGSIEFLPDEKLDWWLYATMDQEVVFEPEKRSLVGELLRERREEALREDTEPEEENHAT